MIATCAQQLCSSLAQCLIIACMHICMGLAPQLKLSPCPAAACPGGLVSRREHQCCHQLQHVTCVGLNMQLAKDEACSMQRCTGRRGGGAARQPHDTTQAVMPRKALSVPYPSLPSPVSNTCASLVVPAGSMLQAGCSCHAMSCHAACGMGHMMPHHTRRARSTAPGQVCTLQATQKRVPSAAGGLPIMRAVQRTH